MNMNDDMYIPHGDNHLVAGGLLWGAFIVVSRGIQLISDSQWKASAFVGRHLQNGCMALADLCLS